MGKLSANARILGIVVVVACAALGGEAHAQFPGLTSPDPSESAPPADAETPAELAPIPPASIPQHARTLDSELAAMRETLRPRPRIEEARRDIATEAADIDRLSRLAEPESLARMNRVALEDLEREFEAQTSTLHTVGDMVEERLEALEETSERLGEANALWTLTREALSAEPDAPEPVVTRADETLATIAEINELLSTRLTEVVELDAVLEQVQSSADVANQRVSHAQDVHRTRILRRGGPPIWKVFSSEYLPEGELSRPAPTSRLTAQTYERFEAIYASRLPLDVILFAFFTLFVLLLSRRARATDAMADPILTSVLGRPLASAFLVGTVFFRFVYFRAPSATFGLMALLSIPPLAILIPVLARREAMRRPLRILLAFCSIEILLVVFPLQTPWGRLTNFAVTLGFLIMLIRFLRTGILSFEGASPRVARYGAPVTRFAGALLAVSLVGQTFGFATIADLLTSGVIVVGYVSLMVLAFVRVLDALIESALTSRSTLHIHSIREHGRLMQEHASSVVHLLGVLIMLFFSFRAFDLYDPIVEGVGSFLDAERTLGSWSFTLGGLLGFVVVLYLTRKAMRLLGFLLDEEILPRFEFERGVPETITRLSKYMVFMFGLLLAVGVAGVDMGSIALLASALSVGIGFGLQNIVNNFVSGLILTFEQPVRVGDTVEVGNMIGKVTSIGARSSTVHTFQGSEVIVPNGDLISNQVINWTLSDQNRRVEIQVGTAYGTDPDQVLELLRSIAMGVREVSVDPGPVALFTGFGDSSLDFELRVWVNTQHDWVKVASELRRRIYRRLDSAGIEIPFPQRDLHLRSVDESAAVALAKSAEDPSPASSEEPGEA